MNYSSVCPTNYSVYPDEFVPLLNEEQFKAYFSLSRERESVQVPVNLREWLDSYEMEFALQGLKREELLIQADDSILSIYGIHQNLNLHNTMFGRSQLNKFQYDYFERRIALPENVDAAFITATYKLGIVSVYIPKTTKPVNSVHQIIVVY